MPLSLWGSKECYNSMQEWITIMANYTANLPSFAPPSLQKN